MQNFEREREREKGGGGQGMAMVEKYQFCEEKTKIRNEL